jgi:hypothetical protein
LREPPSRFKEATGRIAVMQKAAAIQQYEELIAEIAPTKIIIAKNVEFVNFYEVLEADGERVLYFGTEESFRKWKQRDVQ